MPACQTTLSMRQDHIIYWNSLLSSFPSHTTWTLNLSARKNLQVTCICFAVSKGRGSLDDPLNCDKCLKISQEC